MDRVYLTYAFHLVTIAFSNKFDSYSIIDLLTALKINVLIFKVYLNLLKILRPLSLCKNALTMTMLQFVKHIYLVSVMFRFQLAEK